jgi:aspartyl-tRNA(Asn)/glutamyl-tRNA(Gln) amidotransferase subunit A
MDLHQLPIHQAADLLRSRQLRSVDLTRACLERIRALDPTLRAFVTVTEEVALEQAERADRRLDRGENVTPLTGIPFAAKDSITTQRVRTTCSSRMLENYVPPYDATVMERLKGAGAVLVGKTNLDEFSMGSSCENSAFFPTRNPWDTTRVPGGSSGGSAAAVAADMVPFALGADTGGSIRMPAAFCGVVGLKPTYGRVSRYGLVALASSFDGIGPMARDVRDCALVYNTLAGHDPRDSTSLRDPVPDYTRALGGDLKDLWLGIPKEYFVEGIEPGVEQAVKEGIEQLKTLGARTVEVSLPSTPYATPLYYLILFAEASANLARFDGIRFGLSVPEDAADVRERFFRTRAEGFGDEVKRRIMLGTFVLSAGYYDAYYLRAQKVRALLRRDFEQAFSQCDALVTPVCPSTAFPLGEKVDDPLAMYLTDIFANGVNPAGLPAMSMPCGFSAGLPVGMQLIGPHLGEETLFRIAAAYQSATDWHTRRAPQP